MGVWVWMWGCEMDLYMAANRLAEAVSVVEAHVDRCGWVGGWDLVTGVLQFLQ